MAIVQTNVMQSSKNFDGSLSQFLRWLDTPQALWRYILDEAYEKSFFSNFPWLVYRKVSETDRVWDLIYIDEKFNIAGGWPWMPWPYKQTRQLAGNEDIINAAYRRDKMTVGIHRYAIAIENYLQTNLLPDQIVWELKKWLTKWATEVEDNDIACTLFRDYPYYFAETDWLTSWEIDDRIASLFWRWTFNDVWIDPITIMPNGKTDIEALDNTDTLSDVFCQYLQRLADQVIGMPQNWLEDGRPFYWLMCWDADIQNFFKNSSSQFKTSLDFAFMNSQWKHPIYKNFLWDFYWIRFTQYATMASNDGRDELADHLSVYKHMKGSPYQPYAKVLALAWGNETIPDLQTWDRWAYNLANPSSRNWLDSNADSLNLYVSLWATDFPYYAPSWSTTIWSSSYNKFALTGTETTTNNDLTELTTGNLVWRLQIWESLSTANWSKYKILYTWPVFVWNIKINDDKTKYAQVQKVYRLKVEGIYKWDTNAWVFVWGSSPAHTLVSTLKTFLWIETSDSNHLNRIKVSGTYWGITYQLNRKIHVFSTLRTFLFWKDLIYDADILKWQRVEEEKRDYNAVTGWGMTMSKGRKLAVTPDWSIRWYAVVIIKRPPII